MTAQSTDMLQQHKPITPGPLALPPDDDEDAIESFARSLLDGLFVEFERAECKIVDLVEASSPGVNQLEVLALVVNEMKENLEELEEYLLEKAQDHANGASLTRIRFRCKCDCS